MHGLRWSLAQRVLGMPADCACIQSLFLCHLISFRNDPKSQETTRKLAFQTQALSQVGPGNGRIDKLSATAPDRAGRHLRSTGPNGRPVITPEAGWAVPARSQVAL